MSTNFFTNEDGNTLFKKFEGVFTNIPNLYSFEALVGYFRASGYFKLRPYLENIPVIRILAGINVDSISQKYHSIGLEYLKNETETKEDFFKRIRYDIENANYDIETEKGILQFIDDIINQKIQLRAHPDKKIHAKVYIFKPENFNEYSTGSVITGSSNFSKSGFGITKDPVYEFNVELRRYDDVKFASEEFEKLWSESYEILPVDVQKLKTQTYLNESFTPFELYIKLLIEYFGKRVDYDYQNIDLLLPDNYMRLTYQTEAAIEGYEKLMRYNGFFLADVVGLGKTIIASIITKKFIYENGYHTKVLIVYPPALEENWKKTIKDFHISNNVSFVKTGSLHKVLDGNNLDYPNPNEFDLIIIDEAHKFRSDSSQMYERLQTITKTDRKNVGTNGDIKKKVMLLSATPLNNHPSDIENQVYLFQDKRNSNLPTVKDLQSFFNPLKEEYDNLKKDRVFDVKKVKKIFDRIRDKVVEPLVIRRTRKDIENNPDYKQDIESQGIIFPKINPPNKVEYEFDDNLSKLFDTTITYLTSFDKNNDSSVLGFYRYRAIEFLLDEQIRKKYGDVKSISERLSGIMKTLLVKRLESSFHAFKMSLERFKKNTINMINMFESNKIYVAPDIDVNKYLNDGFEDDLEIKINEKGGNNQIFTCSDFRDDFLDLLRKDLEKINFLVDEWEKIKTDPKLDKFLDDIKKVFLNKNNNHSGKLVIFSESKETINYLEKNLIKSGYNRNLAISASNRKEKSEIIRLNFDANQEKSTMKNDYDFILTTEVLAEGINLHRANVIINYDVPWNSTRLMQRIGRVNRIGTEASEINIFNFYPSDKSENQIQLTSTALKKLQAFHSAFGEDSQIYSQLEEIGEAGLYGSKLKEEVNETLLFLQELRDFKKNNPQKFNEIKRIPNKSRLTRKSSNIENSNKLVNTSVTYLKSGEHTCFFYKVGENNIIYDLSFVEFANIFKAKIDEKSEKDLPTNHHEQINLAIKYLKESIKSSENKTVMRSDLSPAEKRILPKLELMSRTTKNEFYKKILKRTIQEIYKGSHKQLPNNIDKFFTKTKKDGTNDLEKAIDNLYKEVLIKFNFSENEIINKEKSKILLSDPKIVISESFV